MIKDRFSEDARRMKPSSIRRLSAVAARPGMISLAGGHPQASTFPVQPLQDVLSELARNVPERALQYGLTRGMPEAVEQVIRFLARRHITATGNEIILTSGSQRALDMIGRLFIDPGDTILVEIPSYPGALSCFSNLQAVCEGIRQDAGGIDPDKLRQRLTELRGQGREAKLLYTIPTYQNPMGTTLSQQRRQAIAACAKEFDLLVVEDDPYCELGFSGEEVTSIRSFAPERTLYLTSFSKIFAPGLRTGAVIGPAHIIECIELAAQACDLCCSMLDQYLLARMLDRGVIADNLPSLRSYYRQQRDTVLAALEEHMPAGVVWTVPQGGFFLWVTLPEHLDAEELLEEAVQKGVVFVPGRHFCVDGSGGNALRIAFSKESQDRLIRGISLLAEIIQSRV